MTETYAQPPRSPEAVLNAHPCTVPNCPTLVSPGHISCRMHWRNVPQDERDPLIAVFRRREQDPWSFDLACIEARRLVLLYAAQSGHQEPHQAQDTGLIACRRCGRSWASVHRADQCRRSHQVVPW